MDNDREFEARGRHVRLPAEIRAGDDGGIVVDGYAAVFGQRADIAGLFEEQIAPGAFTDAIGRDDVVFLINHDGLPLARTRSGTLELTQDDHGLKIRSKLDPTDPDVARIVPKLRRGDLDKMSFAFWPDVESWDDTGPVPVRTIQKARLHDVSIVTTPAYDGTSIGLRSLEMFRENCRAAHNRTFARKRIEMKMRIHPAFAQEVGRSGS